MRYRNKFNINFYNNPYKKNHDLLNEKNALESEWYDGEADNYFSQLDTADDLIAMDIEHETWFADFYDKPSANFAYDKNFHFFDSIPRYRPLRMLELGSGNGAISRFFIRRGIEVISTDVSCKACKFLRKSDARSIAVRGCSEILPFKTGSVDIVAGFLALHHFNLSMSLAEMHRILKPGGIGVFIEPLCNSKWFYHLRQLLPLIDMESPGGGGLNKMELAKIIKSSGFEYWLTEFELITRLERIPQLFRYQDFLKRCDYFLLSKIPFLRRFGRVLVIKFKKI